MKNCFSSLSGAWKKDGRKSFVGNCLRCWYIEFFLNSFLPDPHIVHRTFTKDHRTHRECTHTHIYTYICRGTTRMHTHTHTQTSYNLLNLTWQCAALRHHMKNAVIRGGTCRLSTGAFYFVPVTKRKTQFSPRHVWVVKCSLMGWFYSSSEVCALVHCEAALRDSEWFRPLSLIMESY